MKKVFFQLTKVDDEVAQLDFFVNGINIMEFIQDGQKRVVTWDYDELVDFFEKNLKYIMLEDEFPIDVPGETAAELDNNIELIDLSKLSENEWLSIHEKSYNWRQKHSWLHASGGAILPEVFFRRVKDKIEISWWTDSIYEKEGVEFVNDDGVYYCDLKEFENAVRQFIQDYKKLNLK